MNQQIIAAEAQIVAQRTTALNPAFLAEIKALNRELWGTLEKIRHLCSRPISMRSQSHEIVVLLAKVTELLRMQFVLEEAYGYFANAVEVEPRLSQAAQNLLVEHASLLQSISRLAEFADTLWHEEKLASLTTVVPASFDRFYDSLLDHEEAERDLLSESLLKEIGTGD